MALTNKSLFLFGLQITENNRSIDFKASSGGPTLLATLNLGFYSLSGLADEITRAMNAADPANFYTVLIDRTISAGTQNRVTIQTLGTFLTLLFGSGPRIATSISPLIGFLASDRTGSTAYQGSSSAGTPLLSSFVGFSFLDPTKYKKVYGALNISASGVKEAVTFQLQKFLQAEYRYETGSKVDLEWDPFVSWAIQQRPFDYTPDIAFPGVVYDVTLEKTDADGKGLSMKWTEMLPEYPNRYTTGVMTFRVNPPTGQFIGG